MQHFWDHLSLDANLTASNFYAGKFLPALIASLQGRVDLSELSRIFDSKLERKDDLDDRKTHLLSRWMALYSFNREGQGWNISVQQLLWSPRTGGKIYQEHLDLMANQMMKSIH